MQKLETHETVTIIYTLVQHLGKLNEEGSEIYQSDIKTLLLTIGDIRDLLNNIKAK